MVNVDYEHTFDMQQVFAQLAVEYGTINGEQHVFLLSAPTSVPEPATLALVALALAVAGFGRRKHSMIGTPTV